MRFGVLDTVDSLLNSVYLERCGLCQEDLKPGDDLKGLEYPHFKNAAHWTCFLNWDGREKWGRSLFEIMQHEIAASPHLIMMRADTGSAVAWDRVSDMLWICDRAMMSRCLISRREWATASAAVLPRCPGEQSAVLGVLRRLRSELPGLGHDAHRLDTTEKDRMVSLLSERCADVSREYETLLRRLHAFARQERTCPHCGLTSQDHKLSTPGAPHPRWRYDTGRGRPILASGWDTWIGGGAHLACAGCGGSFAASELRNLARESVSSERMA